MVKDPFTPAQKAKMKCNSDQAIFYKEMIRNITGYYNDKVLFEIDLDDLSWKVLTDTKTKTPTFAFYQDADGNMMRVRL